jgi:RHS repeat-associated protein
MLVPNRHKSSADYRYGFNGKEKDDELKGEGNSYDFGARMLDPRIGRWFARDPLESKYPSFSTYNYALNNPIYFIDPDGMAAYPPTALDASNYGYLISEIKDGETWVDNDGSWKFDKASSTWIGQGTTEMNVPTKSLDEIIITTKSSVLQKVIKTGLTTLNIYSGYVEFMAGVACLMVPEPTVSKAAGVYGIADGSVRMVSGPFVIYGTITDNKRLENAPINVLGLAGNLIDNKISDKADYITGGNAQLTGEILGDLGLSRKNLATTLEKNATTVFEKVKKVFDVSKSLIGTPVSAGLKGNKIKENNESNNNTTNDECID